MAIPAEWTIYWHRSRAICSVICPRHLTTTPFALNAFCWKWCVPTRCSRAACCRSSIHVNFHNNRVTPTQALRELVQIVQIAARQRGRPFNSVLELLPNGDDERDDEPAVNLSPEETLLRDLVNLAITIRDDGQVNPLTVVDVSQGVTRLVSHRDRRAALLGDVAAARLHPRLHRRWHDPVHHHPGKPLIRFSSGEREHLTFWSDSHRNGTPSSAALVDSSWE